MQHKQICLILPVDLVKKAERVVEERRVRDDGLKLTVSAVIRGWAIDGAQDCGSRMGGSLLKPPGKAGSRKCYCPTGSCQAPKVMGRQMPCLRGGDANVNN